MEYRHGSLVMADELGREPARDPQDLERLLVSRERVGDVDGMAALDEPRAVLDCGYGRLTLGKEAIREFYAGVVARVKNLILEISARRLSAETWHSLQPAFPTAAWPLRLRADKATGHGYGSSIASPLHSAAIPLSGSASNRTERLPLIYTHRLPQTQPRRII
jgi:hypothetical protein